MHTHFPGQSSITIPTGRFVHDDRIQQSASSHFSYGRRPYKRAQPVAELLTPFIRIRTKTFFPQHLQSSRRNATGQGIPAVRRAVFAGLQQQHDIFILTQNGRYGQDTATQGFTEDNHVRDDTLFVIDGQFVAGTSQAGLDFVGNEQDIVLGTQVGHLL